MKKIIYFLAFNLITICSYGQDIYMYVDGKKHYYNVSSTKMFIQFEAKSDLNRINADVRKEFMAQNVEIKNINENLVIIDMKISSKTLLPEKLVEQ
jgi:hypothetical protein